MEIRESGFKQISDRESRYGSSREIGRFGELHVGKCVL